MVGLSAGELDVGMGLVDSRERGCCWKDWAMFVLLEGGMVSVSKGDAMNPSVCRSMSTLAQMLAATWIGSMIEGSR